MWSFEIVYFELLELEEIFIFLRYRYCTTTVVVVVVVALHNFLNIYQ